MTTDTPSEEPLFTIVVNDTAGQKTQLVYLSAAKASEDASAIVAPHLMYICDHKIKSVTGANRVTDDFGTTAFFNPAMIALVVLRDLSRAFEGETLIGLAQTRAQIKGQTKANVDPVIREY